jgi:hypothetical protein
MEECSSIRLESDSEKKQYAINCRSQFDSIKFDEFSVQVGRYLPEVDKMFDFSKEKIVAGFEESLERLGLDYVDVLQVGESPIYSFELFTLVRSTV